MKSKHWHKKLNEYIVFYLFWAVLGHKTCHSACLLRWHQKDRERVQPSSCLQADHPARHFDWMGLIWTSCLFIFQPIRYGCWWPHPVSINNPLTDVIMAVTKTKKNIKKQAQRCVIDDNAASKLTWRQPFSLSCHRLLLAGLFLSLSSRVALWATSRSAAWAQWFPPYLRGSHRMRHISDFSGEDAHGRSRQGPTPCVHNISFSGRKRLYF